MGGLPLGLAEDLVLKQPVNAGQVVLWQDVTPPEPNEVMKIRRQLEEESSSKNT